MKHSVTTFITVGIFLIEKVEKVLTEDSKNVNEKASYL